MDSKAVSPLIGFVLLLPIIMGLISIIQSQWVPVWNKQVEAKHLDKLSYEVADMSEAISVAVQTGSSAKVVLDAGVRYPNYYILVSPLKGSSTIWAENLNVTLNGTLDFGSGGILIERKKFSTSAIVVKPNYFYSSSPLFIYEHSAVLKSESNGVIKVSDQSSFSKQRVVLYVVNSTIPSYATTESVNLIINPISYGGFVRFSGNIILECYDEKTAEWWKDTLSNIYGAGNVTKSGKEVNVKLNNAELSIVYAFTSLSNINIANMNPTHLIPLQNNSIAYSLYIGESRDFGVRMLDEFFNPIRDPDILSRVTVTNCNGKYLAAEKGEVWCIFHANSPGSYNITFSYGTNSVEYNVSVVVSPSVGCIFDAWWQGDDLIWNVTLNGKKKSLNFSVYYAGNPVSNAKVYFAITNTTVISAQDTETTTDEYGIAQINLRANANGSASVFGIVASCVDVINITVEGYTKSS